MDKLIKIHGKLTDFDGNIMVDGDVSIKDSLFNDVYITKTDKYGNYSLGVEKGIYMALFGVKDYGVNKIIENTSDCHIAMHGYLIQTSIPEKGLGQEYVKINVALKDIETGEKGEGSLFWEKPKSFDCKKVL